MIKYYCNKSYFNKIDTWEKAYILGFIVADGTVYKNRITFEITIHLQDKSILMFIKKELKFSGKIHMYRGYVRLSVHQKQIKKVLAKYGILPNKTFKTYFPKELIPKKYWAAFILGVFDGDGCISPNKRGWFEFEIKGTRRLLKEIQKILIQECTLNKTKIGKIRNTYRLRYTGNSQIIKIYKFLYNNAKFYFKRKAKIFRNI